MPREIRKTETDGACVVRLLRCATHIPYPPSVVPPAHKRHRAPWWYHTHSSCPPGLWIDHYPLPPPLPYRSALMVPLVSHPAVRMDTREKTSLIHTARRMTWKRKDEKRPFSSLVYPSISPCGRYVACAGDWNGCFHLWDVRSGRAEPMQVWDFRHGELGRLGAGER